MNYQILNLRPQTLKKYSTVGKKVFNLRFSAFKALGGGVNNLGPRTFLY